MNWIEIAATVFGFLCVYFTIRKNIWCWPLGLVQVILYIFVFYECKLYSDMILHVVYVGMQIYGWWYWLRGVKNDRASITELRDPIIWVLLCGVITVIWGMLMRIFTDASLPYWDAFTTVASLFAQYFLCRKVINSWYFWIMVDIVAIGVYFYKSLYFTSGLYVCFLVMAIIGLISWKKNFNERWEVNV
jgi:nicotinamide mononucleotide transporter